MNKWIIGARPRTLSAAVTPVVAASALAYHQNKTINWINVLLALLVGISLQVGVNYSNDYSDGIKGSDDNRVGPIRLVGSGLATPKQVKRAAIFSYLVGAIFGTLLSLRTNWILLAIGAIALLAAWFYTGGSTPYGYRSLGELSVFVFFGLVATLGTYYGATNSYSVWALLLAIEMGLMACAILAINNLRDLPKDALVGKLTLAVRLGEAGARRFLILILFFIFITQLIFLKLTLMAILPIMMAPYALKIINQIRSGIVGEALIPTLGAIAKLQSLMGLWIVIALVASRP